jgi:hypothetical protein
MSVYSVIASLALVATQPAPVGPEFVASWQRDNPAKAGVLSAATLTYWPSSFGDDATMQSYAGQNGYPTALHLALTRAAEPTFRASRNFTFQLSALVVLLLFFRQVWRIRKRRSRTPTVN